MNRNKQGKLIVQTHFRHVQRLYGVLVQHTCTCTQKAKQRGSSAISLRRNILLLGGLPRAAWLSARPLERPRLPDRFCHEVSPPNLVRVLRDTQRVPQPRLTLSTARLRPEMLSVDFARARARGYNHRGALDWRYNHRWGAAICRTLHSLNSMLS